MKIIDKLRARFQTEHVAINSHKCVACWDCHEACPRQVIGKIDLKFHKHSRIQNADACIGCQKCVHVCQHGAITPRHK